MLLLSIPLHFCHQWTLSDLVTRMLTVAVPHSPLLDALDLDYPLPAARAHLLCYILAARCCVLRSSEY